MEGGGGSDYTKEGAHPCGEHHPSDTSWQSNMVYNVMATMDTLNEELSSGHCVQN